MKDSKSVKLLLGVMCCTLLTHCNGDKQSLLHKKWKTVRFENPKMQREIDFMEKYIDTVGNEDKEIVKSTNLDSLKMLLKMDLQHMREEQKIALDNTIMEFKSNGVTYNTSTDGVDSAMYTIEEEKFIKINEADLKGVGESMTFEILSLSKDSLKLRLVDYGDTSVAIMVPTL